MNSPPSPASDLTFGGFYLVVLSSGLSSLDHCSLLTDHESLKIAGLISIISNKRIFFWENGEGMFVFGFLIRPKVSHFTIFSSFFVPFLPFKKTNFFPLFGR